MRTTLVTSDELFSAAKHRAAERNCSLSAVVNDALRAALSGRRDDADSPRFVMPCFAGSGAVVDSSPMELVELVLEDDLPRA